MIPLLAESSIEESQKPNLEPQAGPQTDFVNTKADITIFGGAAGGGKSFGLLLQPRKHMHVKGFGGVVFRRTSPQIRNEGALWDTSELIYSHEAKPRESVLEWEWPNGNQLKFAHMQHEKDKLDWQGSQIPFIGFDELPHFTESQFWYMVSRMRSTCGVKPYMLATCNPVSLDDPIGGWLRSFLDWWIGSDGFVIPERSGMMRWFIRVSGSLVWADSKEALGEKYPNARPKSVTFIPSKLSDNKILEEKDPDYRANLEALPDEERQQLLEANWNVSAAKGTLFKDFDFESIRVKKEDVPQLLELRVTVDPAVTSKDSSDSQGITIDGVTPDKNTLYNFYNWEGIKDPAECIKDACVLAIKYGASSIMFETNQGGDLWKSNYNFIWKELTEDNEYPNITKETRKPQYMEIKQTGVTGSKRERWSDMLVHYKLGRVKHVIGTHEVRERSLKRLPEHKPYDLADAAEINTRQMLEPSTTGPRMRRLN